MSSFNEEDKDETKTLKEQFTSPVGRETKK